MVSGGQNGHPGTHRPCEYLREIELNGELLSGDLFSFDHILDVVRIHRRASNHFAINYIRILLGADRDNSNFEIFFQIMSHTFLVKLTTPGNQQRQSKGVRYQTRCDQQTSSEQNHRPVRDQSTVRQFMIGNLILELSFDSVALPAHQPRPQNSGHDHHRDRNPKSDDFIQDQQ